MSETVSKTIGPKAKEAAVEVAPVVVKKKTLTNWSVFTDGGFIPIRIRCDGYKGNHPADQSCHTNFHPSAENVLRHMASDHGLGTFKIKFRLSDGKTSPLWAELEEAGVEIQEFYCGHCREQVPMSARRIIYHLQSHPGANRVNLDPQTLCISLGFQRADMEEDSALYMREGEI